MKKIILSVLLALFVSTSVFAKDIKIGALVSITGPTAFLGEPERNTLKMIVNNINKNGGVNGNKLDLIVYDTKGNPSSAVILARKLIYSDKVDAIIGPTRSGTTLAIIPLIARSKVPLISMASSYKITTPVKKWVFKTAPSDSLAVERLYSYLNSRKINNVALLTASSGFGASGREELKKLASKYNIKVVADETFGPKDTNMTAQLIKIKNIKSAQALICWGTNPGPASVAKNAREMNLQIPLFMSHGVASKKFIELAGKSSDGIMLPAGKLMIAAQLPKNDPQKDVLLAYKKMYETKYGHVSTFGGHAYDAIHIIVNALKHSKDKESLRSNIEKTKNFIGVTGIFNYSPKNHAGIDPSSFSIIKIKNRNWKLVAY